VGHFGRKANQDQDLSDCHHQKCGRTLILKDMVSARDEATPPEFKELVERYFEVLSGGGPGQ
jgi:hypothetical protein